MEPMEANLALPQPTDGATDRARARELYKYFQPNALVNAETCFPTVSSKSTQYPEPEDRNPRVIPVKSDVTSSKVSSPDTALTAFCQLVTWRIGAQRAMIGLIDVDTQYFVAESTKTVDLTNTDKHAPGDDIWMGCSTVSKAGKLCERTIEANCSPGQKVYPSFIVNDLTKDERFNQLPFVTGPPNLRFYAGVPLITKKRIAIGSLFIVDDFVRDGLSNEDIDFMGTMATTIMKHLEMTREVEARRRGMKMSRGLASFVEGRGQLTEADAETEEGEGSRVAGAFKTESGIVKTQPRISPRGSIHSAFGSTQSSAERREREYSVSMSESGEGIVDGNVSITTKPESIPQRPDLRAHEHNYSHTSLGTTTNTWSPRSNDERGSSTPDSPLSEESSQRYLVSRAANLIRETFEVDGGCIFYDAQAGFAADQSSQSGSVDHLLPDQESHTDGTLTSGDELPSAGETSTPIPSKLPGLDTPLVEAVPSPREPSFSRSSTISRKAVDILGFSTPGAASINRDPVPGPESFRSFQEKALHTLFRRYPRGKLWTFDSDGSVSSSSEEEYRLPSNDINKASKDLLRKKARVVKAKSDAKFLSRHFPGARQLLFVPLWDAGRSRWLSGCFVWSTEMTRILSKQNELSFLTAFGNSVMAEWSRIDTEIANQKKGDFIGSISHELRSPLHGILASAEFLAEEVQSTFQTGMVETITSCGRTLLDTINHVLDFSKINHFERTWRKTRRGITRGNNLSQHSLTQSELPMINLYADVDISVVCEEVIEGVHAGHIFQSGTAANFDMVGNLPSLPKEDSITSSSYPQGPVALIFDADLEDYYFTTQPGAFRRIVMNILGNALKYTSHGYVRIKLSSTPMDDFHDAETGEVVPRAMVHLMVTDTGKGIAPEFLRSKLFTPFTQENSLSSGTGLGLAIVKSIVHILEGEITIESEVGRGTQVRVSLPLLRGNMKAPDSVSTNTPKSITSFTRHSEDSVAKVRSLVVGKRVALHGFDAAFPDPISQKMSKLMKSSVTNFLSNWYGMLVVPADQKANVIISNEGAVPALSKLVRTSINNWRTNPTVIVLSSHSSRFDRTAAEAESKLNLGYVNKPVGPLKLGKAIAQCYESSRPATPIDVTPMIDSNDMSNVFEEMTLSPKGSELLDNSRMAADSDNARKAIESPTPNALSEQASEFPFPAPSLPKAKTLPIAKELGQPLATNDSLEGDALDVQSLTPAKLPSYLLVDDNAINLKLLSTSITKRKAQLVDQAMDGLAAVKKFQERQQGYDVIFMDISMPLLDGFGATKEIRAVEQSRKLKAAEENIPFTPALVIAITGLASSDDQAHAAQVGVDLFLTKPVSFKDVKKMLDNWEANREKDLKL